MRTILTFALATLALLTTNCTTTPKTVTSGVVTPRNFVLDPVPPQAEEGDAHLVSMGLGYHRSPGFTSSGQKTLANSGSIWVELRPHSIWSLGIRPYYGGVDPEIDEASHLGIEFYTRLRLIKMRPWQVSFSFSYKTATNSASDKDDFCFLFFCSIQDAQSFAKAELNEFGLALPVDILLSDTGAFSVVPAGHYSIMKTSTRVSGVAISDFKENHWNFSAMAYGTLWFSPEKPMALRFGGGAAQQKGFGDTDRTRRWAPLIEASLQFALGDTKTAG